MESGKLKKLKQLRVKKNYTYKTMADLLSISKPYYWQIENKERGLSYIMACKIAKVFEMKPDDVFYQDLVTNLKQK
jgi:putative transcriptional regulator